jgi:hypothetical protein
MTAKASKRAAEPRARAQKPAASAAAAAAPSKTSASRASKPAAQSKLAAAPQDSSKAPVVQAVRVTETAPIKASKKPTKLRPVLVRDSFTMPETDFALLALLKARALGASRAAKKSELLRAGLQLLHTLDTSALVAALDRLETVKTGRPKKKG